MNIKNLEAGLTLRMKAVFRSRGLSEADAKAKIEANLTAASALFYKKLAEGHPTVTSKEAAPAYAMSEVARWARSL